MGTLAKLDAEDVPAQDNDLEFVLMAVLFLYCQIWSYDRIIKHVKGHWGNKMPETSSDLDEIKFLAEMTSGSVKWSNKNWLAVMVVAFVITFPNVSDRDQVTLPFALASVDRSTFDLIGFFILAATIVAFCQGYASAQSAHRLAHKQIDQIDIKKREEYRKYFDYLSASTYWRIAPLSNSLLWKKKDGSWSAALIYILLKLTTTFVVFGIPALALLSSFWRAIASSGYDMHAYFPAKIQLPLVWIVFAGASSALAIDLCKEIGFIVDVSKFYITGKFPVRMDAD